MSKLHVTQSSRPSGVVRVSGAKNAATRLLAASMLADEAVQLFDFPCGLIDARHKARFIEAMGGEVIFDEEQSVARAFAGALTPGPLDSYEFPVRTTYLLAAGQLLRGGRAWIPYPGGCKLGDRKYDLHVMVWNEFGCIVRETAECIEIEGKLKGAEIHFPISTVGGTENAILCACAADGITTIFNAYVTPEIENLVELLRLMGAEIRVEGTSKITIEGGRTLRGASIRCIPDRIEALTWMVFAAITGGTITVENVPFDMMRIPLIHLQHAGLDSFLNAGSVHASPGCIGTSGLQPFELACGTHPGVISDMQPLYVLLALFASGRSKIFDYRYPLRTAYLAELSKIFPGALEWKPGEITVNGPATSSPAFVTSTDLRGSIAMVLAAFVAGRDAVVDKVEMSLRGYDQLANKLRTLGLHFEIDG